MVFGSAYFFAGACGPSEQKSYEDDDGAAGATTSTLSSSGGEVGSGGHGGATSVPGGPSVETFTADPAMLESYDDVLLVAEVSDPDGLADIVGGVVKDDAGATYGTMLKSGGGGAFALTLNWDEIEAVAPIEFTSAMNGTRILVAEFTDASGNIGSKNLTLELACYNSYGYCDGNCVDTNTSNQHCGSCNNACLCMGGGNCSSCDAVSSGSSCASICASKGKTCSADACTVVGRLYTTSGCSGTASSTNYCQGTLPSGILSVECCCV